MCKCKIENEEDFYCRNEIYENGNCILHCDKRNWYKIDLNGNKVWDKKKVNLFWRKIQRDLNSTYETSFYERSILDNKYLFDNVIFPSFQKDIKYCVFTDNQEEQGTNFYDYEVFEKPNTQPYPEVNNIFNRLNLNFYKCTFLDNAYFFRYHFTHDILFQRCTFENNVDFAEIKFDTNKFKFIECNVKGEASFYRTKFHRIAAFDKTKFNKVNFRNCRFHNLARFISCEFRKEIDFKYTYFYKNVVFNEMKIRDKINIEKAIFFENTNFYNIEYQDNSMINRESARIIKDSFEQQNNIIEANKFFALEMKERDKELKWKTDFFEKLIFKFHGISSNHSQNWLLALFWILVIGMLSSTIDFFYFSNEPCIVYAFSITNLSLAYSSVFIFYYLIATYFDGNYFKTTLSLFAIVPIYWYLTRDFLFCNFSKTINPFSIMKSAEDINIIQLFFKIIIAYLIYQLIISIRQNTRRK